MLIPIDALSLAQPERILIANGYKNNWQGYYIGRKHYKLGLPPSALANPYTVEEYGRKQCLVLYRKYLKDIVDKFLLDTSGTVCTKKEIEVMVELAKLALALLAGHTITLCCFCAPKPCHGASVRFFIEYLVDMCSKEQLEAFSFME
jgi:hypothetical protein